MHGCMCCVIPMPVTVTVIVPNDYTIVFDVLEGRPTRLSLTQSLCKNLSHSTGQCQSSQGFCSRH